MLVRLRNRVVNLIDASLMALEKLRRKLTTQEFELAIERDIYYCYRLFLHRSPDAAGYELYRNLVTNQIITIGFLTDLFLYSPELQAIQEERNRPVLVELPDFQIFVRLNDHLIGYAIARQKIYEPHVSRVLMDLLRPGLTFLDIGANIGYFSLMAAAFLQNKGQVIAFEPVKENCELFARSIQANHYQNIELFPYAVSESEKYFALDMAARSSNSRMITNQEPSPNQAVVQAVALDEFLADLKALDIVKIDIEGAEPLALKGMQSLINRFRPHILCEFSPPLILETSQGQPVDFLNQLVAPGYELRIIYPDGILSESLAPAQILEQFKNAPERTHFDLLATPLS